MNQVVNFLNTLLWDSLLIYMLLAAGIWFSVRLKLIQIRHFGHMFTLLKIKGSGDSAGISSFQALMTSLAARVGTGNLAGVAIAIAMGGPGAIFWMWVIALLGMATGYAESLLAQVYKVRDAQGEFRGGPAYYIKKGLNSPRIAFLFSSCIFIGYGFIFSSVQANTMADALENTYQVPTEITGIVLIVLTFFVLTGGVKLVAKVSSVLVPFMGVAYMLLAIYVCLVHIDKIPAVFQMIFASAFGLQEAGAGAIGAALIHGIKRGLYSNEAGAGTVPHAAACASPNPHHPATQGYVQMLGVFIDTIVICSATAFIILLAYGPETEGLTGIRLTQYAMTSHLGDFGEQFIAIAICFFSFTSIIANYVYAENNLHLFKLDSKLGHNVLLVLFLSMAFWGTTATLPKVWALADLSLGVTTVINVIAIVCLSPTIIRVTKDYHRQYLLHRETQKKPVFKPCLSDTKTVKIQGSLEKSIWS